MHLYLERAALFCELPRVARTAGKAAVDAQVRLQIFRRFGDTVFLKITGSSHHQKSGDGPDRHGHHVVGEALAKADARVEPVAHDVDHSVFGDDLELHIRAARMERAQHRCQHHARGVPGHVEPQLAAGRFAHALHVVQGLAHVLQGGGQAIEQHLTGLGRRDAAGGAMQQAQIQRGLELPQAVAERRRGHAQLPGRLAEAAALGHACKGGEGVETGGSMHRAIFHL